MGKQGCHNQESKKINSLFKMVSVRIQSPIGMSKWIRLITRIIDCHIVIANGTRGNLIIDKISFKIKIELMSASRYQKW